MFDIVEITAPNDQKIDCAKRGSVLVPIKKVFIFGMAKVEFSEREELENLKLERKLNQSAFSKDEAKVKRLKSLKEGLEYNYKRSQGNLNALLSVGIIDSVENGNKIISHLLDVGAKITNETLIRYSSRLDAPAGVLKVVSTWKILEDGSIYLTTLHFEG